MPKPNPTPRSRSVGNVHINGDARDTGHLCIHREYHLTHRCECKRVQDHVQLADLERPVPTDADVQPTLF